MDIKEMRLKRCSNLIRALFVLSGIAMLLSFLLTGCAYGEEITLLTKESRQYTAGDNTNYSTTTYEYDDKGNLIREVYDDGISIDTIEYTYDSNGNLLSEKQDNGNASSYMYDSENNMISEVSISGFGTTTILYTYDGFGNILTKKEVYSTEGKRSGYSSDREDGDVSYTTYTYDDMKRVLTQATVFTGKDGLKYSFSTSYEYMDTADLVSNEYYTYSGDIEYSESISYTYDLAGNILSKICVDQRGNCSNANTTYTYDQNGNILCADCMGSGSFSTAFGQRGMHYEHYYEEATSRIITYRTYDEHGYLLTERTVNSSYSDEYSFVGNSIEISYSYDSDHNIVSKEELVYNKTGSLLSKTLNTYEYISVTPANP